jgi:hypothetical protein
MGGNRDAESMVKGRIATLGAALVVLFGISSCLEVDQVITVKGDGSGTITEEMLIGKGLLTLLKDIPGDLADHPLTDLYQEEKYEKLAVNYGVGVNFLKMERIARDGGEGVRVTYRFADINQVVIAPGSTLDELNMNEEKKGLREEPLRFEYAAGVLTVEVPDLSGSGTEREEESEAKASPVDLPALEKVMMQMFKGMKISSRLVVEPGIQESDATYQEGNVITFLKFDFDKIMENPKGIQAMDTLDGSTRVEMKAALEGVEGAVVETKEWIRVKVGSD